MTVSVVIPSFNRAHTLSRAIGSVLSQTYKDIEIIVVDDRSTDDTRNVLSAYDTVLCVPNSHARGPAGARNQGIEVSSGEYIAFLDSDDEWCNKHLEESLYYLKNCGVGASYALWYRQRGNSWEGYPSEWLDFLVNELGLKTVDLAIMLGDKIAEYMIYKPFWCFHVDTLVISRDALLRSGVFDESFRTAEDMELSFRILLNVPSCLINSYHALYYEGDDNMVAVRNKDPTKMRRHYTDMVVAFKKILGLVEAFLPSSSMEKCLDQLNRKIAEYEILC